MIQIILMGFLLGALIHCLRSSRDVFSPAKFYHAFLCVYCADIFISPHNDYVYGVYAGYILVGILMTTIESMAVPQAGSSHLVMAPDAIMLDHVSAALWVFSLLPVLAQMWLIHVAGGLAMFDRAVATRVEAWRGLGHILIVIRLMPTLNLAYYAIGILKARSALWWCFYGLHLALFILMALLSGSRSFLLYHLLSILIVRHYLRTPIRLESAVVAGLLLLTAACVLGEFRGRVVGRTHDVSSVAEESIANANLRLFSYGTQSLDIIFENEFVDLQAGTTFASAITNFVPRACWPDKFDTGGVVLAKFAHGGAYTGKVHLWTGILTESVLNFGYTPGILAGFGLAFLAVILNVRLYRFWLARASRLGPPTFLFTVLVYPRLVSFAARLLCAEFAQLLVVTAIECVLAASLVTVLWLWTTRCRHRRSCIAPHPHGPVTWHCSRWGPAQ